MAVIISYGIILNSIFNIVSLMEVLRGDQDLIRGSNSKCETYGAEWVTNGCSCTLGLKYTVASKNGQSAECWLVADLDCRITLTNTKKQQTLVAPKSSYILDIMTMCTNFLNKLYIWNTDGKEKGTWKSISRKPYQQFFDIDFKKKTLITKEWNYKWEGQLIKVTISCKENSYRDCTMFKIKGKVKYPIDVDGLFILPAEKSSQSITKVPHTTTTSHRKDTTTIVSSKSVKQSETYISSSKHANSVYHTDNSIKTSVSKMVLNTNKFSRILSSTKLVPKKSSQSITKVPHTTTTSHRKGTTTIVSSKSVKQSDLQIISSSKHANSVHRTDISIKTSVIGKMILSTNKFSLTSILSRIKLVPSKKLVIQSTTLQNIPTSRRIHPHTSTCNATNISQTANIKTMSTKLTKVAPPASEVVTTKPSPQPKEKFNKKIIISAVLVPLFILIILIITGLFYRNQKAHRNQVKPGMIGLQENISNNNPTSTSETIQKERFCEDDESTKNLIRSENVETT